MSKRALVTGGGGFIGRAVAELLSRRGFEVHAAGRGQRRPALDKIALDKIVWHVADLLRPGVLAQLLNQVRPTHVVHAAWEVTPGQYRTSPANDQWLAASRALLDHASAHPDLRLIGVGTCFEYDLSAGWLSEADTPCRPQTPYGKAKLQLCAEFERANSKGISTAWGRIFFPFGPGEASGRLLPAVAEACLAGRELDCIDGSQMRDFIYVDEVAAQIGLLAESRVTGTINLCSGAPVALRTVIDGLANRLGGAHLIRYGRRPAGGEDMLPLIAGSTERLRRELGWSPSVTMDEALERTAGWWRSRAAAN